jgi:hypothetical protein
MKGTQLTLKPSHGRDGNQDCVIDIKLEPLGYRGQQQQES